MSFKREGNDGSWLRSLQQRRVSELLSEDIREGEAHLMRNGKFACMICNHRPVFDTVNMLSVHRNGKKHLASVSYKEMQEDELEQLKRTRLHEEYTKTGMIADKLMGPEGGLHEKANVAALLGSKPYDSRVKRRPDRRRQTLDLRGQEAASCSNSSTEAAIPQTIAEYKKNVRLRNEKVHIPLKPYERLRAAKSNAPCTNLMAKTDSSTSECNSSQIPHCNRGATGLVPVVEVPVSLYNSQASRPETDQSANKTAALETDRAKLREKYLQATASGWKKDRTGTWVRDDDVEFDSDDEPPDIQ